MRTPRQVEMRTGRSALASLAYQPKFQSDNLELAKVEKLLSADQAQAILSEILLATQSQSQASARCVTIGVLASDTGAGASTVATALSHVGSRDLGLRSVVIDAQLHSESMRLAQLSAEVAPHAEDSWEDERWQLTRMSDGPPRQLLRFDGRGKSPLLSEFQAEHDVVFIDLPSKVRPDWLSLMTQHLDFMLVVVQANKSQAATTNQLIRRLERNAVAVGLVVNKTRRYVPRALESLVG
jgi:Mrp family chromosome partitioning ATPase